MRVLAVTYANRVPNNDLLYEALSDFVELDRIEINRTQALRIQETLASIEPLDYDRIVLEVRAKHAMSQWRDLWKLPNLVLYEEDTWQNYTSFSKNYGLFAQYYERVQPVRILHSGYEVAEKTRALGFDSCFLPKGYDGSKLRNLGKPRDIELGFIGRVEHKNYINRKRVLNELAESEGLQLLRTSSDEEYLNTLNRIRYFISADVGFGEHMIKNFEALACGCVLFAYRQGLDDDKLGFHDMDNVVLYKTTEELSEKLARLREDSDLSNKIANNGQALAEANHDHQVLGKKYYELLKAPLRMANFKTWEKGRALAAKQMSSTFYSKHWSQKQRQVGENVFDIEDRELQFRLFDVSRFKLPFVTDNHERFVEQAYEHAKAGVAVPKIQYWGIQKELNLYWVAYDRLQACGDIQELEDKHLEDLVLYVARLHCKGMSVAQLQLSDIALDVDGNLVWVAPNTDRISKTSLSSQQRQQNLDSLLVNPGCLLHRLGNRDDVVNKYAAAVNATEETDSYSP